MGDSKQELARAPKTPEWRKRSARVALLSALRALDNDGNTSEADALGFALIAVTQLRYIDGAEQRLNDALERLGNG